MYEKGKWLKKLKHWQPRVQAGVWRIALSLYVMYVYSCWPSPLQTTEDTRAALEKLVQSKISAAQPVRAAEKQAPAQYIR